MKKVIFAVILLIGLVGCEKDVNCYECYYQYYNDKLDSSKIESRIICDKTEKEIDEIAYKGNERCIKK